MHAAGMSRIPISLILTVLLAFSAVEPVRAGVDLPGGAKVTKVDFERHIMGLFGRMGCNSGSCHGSFQGKNGFRLSLFGYDPARDFQALTRDLQGRRVNRADPDDSLLLLKSLGHVAHGGGRRFAKGSWQYQLFREWIADGANWSKGSGTIKSMTLSPAELDFTGPDQVKSLKVMARFADDSEEDVTPFCDFRTNDDAVAEVSPLGQVQSLRAGDTALVVSYRGHVHAVHVLVPMTLQPGFRYPEIKENNFIDHEVYERLRRLNVAPSEASGDAEFLRRLTIDTIGSLPSPQEVREFLADNNPDKRAKMIDQLLAHPLHAALWATKFCDITGNNTADLEGQGAYQTKQSQMWHNWFRQRLAKNMPYDEIVQGVLCATSRDGQTPDEWLKQYKSIEDAAAKGFDTTYQDRPTLDLFWRKRGNVPIEQWGEKTAAAFLGIRLECAQCHKHPFDRWTQTDYRAFANVFGQVAYAISPEAKQILEAENGERKKEPKGKQQRIQVREVFLGGKTRSLPDPDTGKALLPKALGGPAIPFEKGKDARKDLYDWMHSPDNLFFARSFANRVWGHYLGVGLVDPVDDFSEANPPSNDKLLNLLARDFTLHHYDLRHLERMILNSGVYQLTSATNPTNKLDKRNYSHSYLRPMMAEVVLDVLDSALGVTENFGADAPAGSRAIEVGSSRVQNGTVAYLFRTFGRPARTTACDCERTLEPALPQKLFLMTDPSLSAKFADKRGRLKQLLNEKKSDKESLEELFLATLSRYPTEAERKRHEEFLAKEKDRAKAYSGTLWALINTREFILNH